VAAHLDLEVDHVLADLVGPLAVGVRVAVAGVQALELLVQVLEVVLEPLQVPWPRFVPRSRLVT